MPSLLGSETPDGLFGFEGAWRLAVVLRTRKLFPEPLKMMSSDSLRDVSYVINGPKVGYPSQNR